MVRADGLRGKKEGSSLKESAGEFEDAGRALELVQSSVGQHRANKKRNHKGRELKCELLRGFAMAKVHQVLSMAVIHRTSCKSC